MKKISAYTVKDILTMRLGLETRVTVLGYTQRGGTPCAYDRYLSTLQGMEAVKAILDVPPTPLPCIITIHGSKIERTPLLKAVTLTKNAYEYDENDELGKAIKARNLDLKRYHEAYLNTVSPNHHDRGLSPSKVGSACLCNASIVLSLIISSECGLPSFMWVCQQVA